MTCGVIVFVFLIFSSLQSVLGLRCIQCSGVSDPSKCNVSVTCSAGQACSSKKYMVDDQGTYNLGCTDENSCSESSSVLSGIVGRRSSAGLLVNITCCLTDFCNSQYQVSTKSQEFLILLPVMTEVSDDSAFCTIEIIADVPCTATLDDGSSNKISNLRLNSGLNSFKMSEILECCGNGKDDPFTLNGGFDRALYLTVSQPVTVYGNWQLSYDENHVHDRFLILPVSMLGTEYLMVNFYRYSTRSNCIIGATQDHTNIKIEYNTTNYIFKSDSSYENETGTYLLDKGKISMFNNSGAYGAVKTSVTKTYKLDRMDKLIVTEAFLTGSRIISDQPIAVYMEERDMNTCYFQRLPQCRYSKSNLVHPVPRSSSAGRIFVIPEIAPGVHRRVKIVPVNGASSVTLTINDDLSVKTYQVKANDYLEVDLGKRAIRIDGESDLIVFVLAFDDYSDNLASYGNSVFMVPSVSQYSNQHTFPISVNSGINETCYISLMLPYQLRKGVLVNGRSMESITHTTDFLYCAQSWILRFSPGEGVYNITHRYKGLKFGSLVYCSGRCSPDTCGLFEDDPRTESLSASGYVGGLMFNH